MSDYEIVIPYEPRDWQIKIHKGLKRYNVLVVHRRGGKTFLCIQQLIHSALTFTKQLGRFGYVAPQLNQAKEIAWDYVRKFVAGIPGAKVNKADLTVTFEHNGARIKLYGADNPDSLRGGYFDGVVCDEYAQMDGSIWGEIIRPMLADRKGWIIFIGTPKGINAFKTLYDAAVKDEYWFTARLTCYDTDALDNQEIEDARAIMTEQQFAQEMLCDFNASADDVLIPLSMVEEAAKRHLRPDEYNYASRIIGVDPARYGDDNSCIIKRQGLLLHPPRAISKFNTMEVADAVAHEAQEFNPQTIVVDVTGLGAGVVDRLTQLGYPVTEVNFGAASPDPTMYLMRTYIWQKLHDWIKAGGAIPNDEILKADISAPLYKHGSNGKKALEPKEATKKRLQRSPDRGDAAALACSLDLKPNFDVFTPANRQTDTVETDYDPWASI